MPKNLFILQLSAAKLQTLRPEHSEEKQGNYARFRNSYHQRTRAQAFGLNAVLSVILLAFAYAYLSGDRKLLGGLCLLFLGLVGKKAVASFGDVRDELPKKRKVVKVSAIGPADVVGALPEEFFSGEDKGQIYLSRANQTHANTMDEGLRNQPKGVFPLSDELQRLSYSKQEVGDRAATKFGKLVGLTLNEQRHRFPIGQQPSIFYAVSTADIQDVFSGRNKLHDVRLFPRLEDAVDKYYGELTPPRRVPVHVPRGGR